MTISMNEVPNSRRPALYTEIDGSGAQRNGSANKLIALIVGQKLATGEKQVLKPFLVTSEAQAIKFFGKGSMLHEQLAFWFKGNKQTEVWAMAIDDAVAGVKATGSLTIEGPATAAGILPLRIGGISVPVSVLSGDAGDALATKVAAAITANDSCPLTAVVDGANPKKVTLTYKHKGAAGNGYPVMLSYYDDETIPAGVQVSVVALAGGNGDPEITPALAEIGDLPFSVFVAPYLGAENLTILETVLGERFKATKQLDGHLFLAKGDSLSALVTFGDSRNSNHVSILGNQNAPESNMAWASNFAAVSAKYLELDPARQLNTCELQVLPPKKGDRFTAEEQGILLNHGISTFEVASGDVVVLSRVITMYKKNALGADDEAFLDIMSVFTLSFIRKDWNGHIARKYPRHKLADDGTRFGAGQAIVTPNILKCEAIAKFEEWEKNGMVEGFAQFKSSLISEKNSSVRNRNDIFMAPDLIDNLMIVGTKIGFLL